MTENITDRVEELESRLAFQDDLLDTLNQTVTDQDQRISRLEAALLQLSKTISAAGIDINTGDERPPHY